MIVIILIIVTIIVVLIVIESEFVNLHVGCKTPIQPAQIKCYEHGPQSFEAT